MDLSDLIDRNAAFAPDKAAIRFAGPHADLCGLRASASPRPRGRSQSQWRVGPGDRVAVLATNHPDTLVLLYACARLGAMLVPVNWRLAVPEQLYILADASVKALVVEQALADIVAPLRQADPAMHIAGLDFAPDGGTSVRCVPARRQAATAAAAAPISPRRCSSSTRRARPAGRRARCCARRRSLPTPR